MIEEKPMQLEKMNFRIGHYGKLSVFTCYYVGKSTVAGTATPNHSLRSVVTPLSDSTCIRPAEKMQMMEMMEMQRHGPIQMWW